MKTKKYLFAVMVAFALVSGASYAAQQVKPKQPKPTWGAQTAQEKRKLHDVRMKQGLKEAAKLYGGYVEAVDFDDNLAAADLAVPAYQSELVVRGVIKSHRSVIILSKEGARDEPIENVVTDYTVLVLEVYKGDVRLIGRDITVRIPGGRVEWEEGLYAEVRTPGFLRPLNHTEFIVFLRPFGSERGPSTEENVYSVTMGRQGMFEIKNGKRVTPRARFDWPIAKSTPKELGAFVKSLNAAIAKADRIKAQKKNGK